MSQGDTRCIDGTLFKHLPQWDDPEFEQAAGRCPECEGRGCRECDCCGQIAPLSRGFAAGGIETFACDDCRQIKR